MQQEKHSAFNTLFLEIQNMVIFVVLGHMYLIERILIVAP